jgi:hypothetical protein
MSTTASSPAGARSSSVVGSAAFRTFVVVFAIATPVIYTICEMANLPLFTYHPGTNRFDLGFAPAVRDEGPAMYWYGWNVSMLLGSGILGLIAMKMPESLTRKIPLALTWIVPLAVVPVLIYALRFFWRW